MRKWLVLLVVAATVAGCSHNKRDVGDIEENQDSTLHVENHHWGDVDVWVIHDGQRTRVGTVTASTEATYTLSSRLIGTVGSLQLQAHAVGLNGSLSSESIAIRPGGMQLNWTLESNLSHATLSVY